MLQNFLRSRFSRRIFLLAIVTCLLASNIWLGNSSRNDNEENCVVWFVESVITAKEFPIGINDAEYNYSIYTSWGELYVGISEREYPYLIWVQIPDNLPTGTGSVVMYIEDELRFNKSISWDSQFNNHLTPINITFVYHWFSYWVGRSTLTVTLHPIHNSQFQYTITSNYYNRTQYMPYEENFEFSTILNLTDWFLLETELSEKQAYSWQSWNFPPTNYTGYVMAMCDGGGNSMDVKIEWNDSVKSTYSELVDNDGCTGERIYSNQNASLFSELLLSILDKYIDAFLSTITTLTQTDSTTLTTQTTTTKIDFISLRILFLPLLILVLIQKRMKGDS